MREGRRVAVTGIGIISPAGNSAEEAWDTLKKGKSCIGRITRFDPSSFRSQIAGEVRNFDASGFLETKDLKRMDLFLQYAIVSAGLALEDSGIIEGNWVDRKRIGTIVGSGIGGIQTLENNCRILFEKGPSRINPHFIPYTIGNMAGGLIAIKYDLRGPNICTTTACSSGSHAIGEAMRMIRHSYIDAAVAGASEAAVTPLSVGGFCAMRALSERNNEPEKASRPFDKDRDGFVIGEGACVLVLEAEEIAKKRGAKIYCYVDGYWASGDAYHITAPDEKGEGAIQCMKGAIEDAAISIDSISYINAHGTSTQLNDRAETFAIKRLFGEHSKKLMVSSTKSFTGHLLGAAGSLEAAFTALTVYTGYIPPTLNLENPDPECDLDYVPNEGRDVDVKYAMNNSFGFGGTNACLVFSKA